MKILAVIFAFAALFSTPASADCGPLCDYAFWVNASAKDVQARLDNGADPRLTNGDHQTPLHHAVKVGNLAALLVLLGAEIDLNAQDSWGQTPVHLAASSGSPTTLRALLKAGANLDILDGAGATALHYAAMGAQPGNIQILVEAGVFIDVLDTNQSTPLHWAAELGAPANITALLAAGADVNAATPYNGKTALDLVFGPSADTKAQILRAAGGKSGLSGG